MSLPLLEARGITRTFAVRKGLMGHPLELRAVDGVDLALAEGETLGVAGESGCGKSTLGKILMDLLPPSSGTVSFRGERLDGMNAARRREFRRQVQMIFQDPYASLNPRMRVGEIIGEPLRIHGIVPSGSIRDRVLELMARVGLDETHYLRYPHEFSGGQRQRVGIARALAVSPRAIIADEPVSALDISIQAQILNLLRDLRQEYGLAMLFIAHDLSVVRHMSSRIAIMYLGKIVERGGRDDVFDRCLHPYTEALISAIPTVVPGGKGKRIILKGDLPSPVSPPAGCPFHPRCVYAEEICTRTAPPLTELEPEHWAACHLSGKLFR